ncbi:MAG TPA: DUF3352 domain-containing protein [Solirubrobacteraceae bacterium]|nr:DUF3352 domain-containing protein [Solirubrobacteraceae bacterium]
MPAQKGTTLLAASSPLRSQVALRRRSTFASIALVIGLAGALAGCGSSSPSGTSADPASAVPAAAALYAGATVRPEGQLHTAALAAGKALTHQANPYLRLLSALQTPGSPQLNYEHEVAPWLGPHAAIFLSSLSSSSSALLSLVNQGLLGGSAPSAFPFATGGVQGAIVLDTSNPSKALAFLDTQAHHAGAHASSYRGISYETSSAGIAFALVKRFAVIGSVAGIHSVIDTTLGGSSLAQAAGYAKLLAAAPTNALAHIYTSPASTIEVGKAEGTSGLLALLAGGREANISLVPTASTLTFDADTLAASLAPSTGPSGGLLAVDPQGAQALGELPGESWLAIGLGHLSTTITQDVQGLQSLGSLMSTLSGSGPESNAGLSLSGILGGMITPLSALGANTSQAKADFASWMGSAGIFASGSSLLELRAAVVISSNNPTRSRAAVAELAKQLRKGGASANSVSIPGTEAATVARVSGLPVALDIAAGRDAAGQAKFVLGIGEASVAAALHPSGTLSSSATGSAAASALGEGAQPSLVVNFPTMLGLLEGLGLTESPSISKLMPYLRSLSTLAGGGHALGGGVERFKLALGLQPTG